MCFASTLAQSAYMTRKQYLTKISIWKHRILCWFRILCKTFKKVKKAISIKKEDMWRFYLLVLHCKKSRQKTPPAWPDVTDSLVRGTENFFNMKIELIRRVATMKTEYFEISWIFLRLIWQALTIISFQNQH
jgi:hypothetical protein